ncbi:tyrosine-type recombinase/integrase [Halalkalicoccus salilacus]|uniref:tyrosine-type recombinase/integrase n=1 Tax=Halalkalicoccus salilacus TaxID=3117459 RepID=UPI0038D4E82A
MEQVHDACLTDAFPNYLQGRNETIVTLLADTGLRVSELVALDWDHVDLNADPAELYLPCRGRRPTPGASFPAAKRNTPVVW